MAANKLILLAGASGNIEGRLLMELEARGGRVLCRARQPEFLRARVADNTEIVAGDVLAGICSMTSSGLDFAPRTSRFPLRSCVPEALFEGGGVGLFF